MKVSKFVVLVALFLVIVLVGCAPAAAPPTATPAADTPAPAAPAAVPAADTAIPTATTAALIQAGDTNRWEVILETKVEYPAMVAGFLNDTFGITAGTQGKVYYTTDGGKTWSQAKNSSPCRLGLDVVDENVAWNGGEGGRVLGSTDGGRNWPVVSLLGGVIPFISFLDAETGWAASSKQLWMTTDGSQTWAKITLPEGVKDFAAIALRTARDGYLLDKTGALFIRVQLFSFTVITKLVKNLSNKAVGWQCCW